MNSWCESCARKGCCYGMETRPKCYVSTTNTASGTPKTYLAKSLRYSRDSHEIADTPQTDNGIGCSRCEGRYDCYDRNLPRAVYCNNYGKITDEPQTECKMPYEDCEDCETHLKAQYGDCNECKWYGDKQVCGRCRSRNLYASKTEPQTEYQIKVQEAEHRMANIIADMNPQTERSE